MDLGTNLQQTSDGGFILIGYTASIGNGKLDSWLIRTDSEGNELWDKTYGGHNNDFGVSVIQLTDDDGIIMLGSTESFGRGKSDLVIIQTDDSGNGLWLETFGGIKEEYGASIQQTMDGGYIVSGYTWSYGAGAADYWLIKLNLPL